MKLEEFRARFDELRRMRESLGKYVVLSDRLTELVEAYLEAADEERFQAERITLTPQPEKAPVGDDHFYVATGVETRALLSEVAA